MRHGRASWHLGGVLANVALLVAPVAFAAPVTFTSPDRFYSVRYDPAKWERMPKPPGLDIALVLAHAGRPDDVAAMLVAFNGDMTYDELRASVDSHGREGVKESRVVFQEHRQLAGGELLVMRRETTREDGTRVTYVGRYWTGRYHVVQLFVAVRSDLYPRYQRDAAELLDALEIISPPPDRRSALFRAAGLGAVIAGILAGMAAVIALVHLNAAMVVSRHPVTAEQRVTFDAPGNYVLNTEAGWFTMAFRGVEYSLQERASGAVAACFRIYNRRSTSAGAPVRKFVVPRAGEYIFRVHNLSPERDTSGLALVFTRSPPFRGGWWIVVLVGAVGAVLAGLVLML